MVPIPLESLQGPLGLFFWTPGIFVALAIVWFLLRFNLWALFAAFLLSTVVFIAFLELLTPFRGHNPTYFSFTFGFNRPTIAVKASSLVELFGLTAFLVAAFIPLVALFKSIRWVYRYVQFANAQMAAAQTSPASVQSVKAPERPPEAPQRIEPVQVAEPPPKPPEPPPVPVQDDIRARIRAQMFGDQPTAPAPAVEALPSSPEPPRRGTLKNSKTYDI